MYYFAYSKARVGIGGNGNSVGGLLSILLNFGTNLRNLCKTRESIAQVCRDLDINRVQFNRYMSGHSFPKPNVLDRICEYFDVDGRIYLELLNDVQINLLKSGGSIRHVLPASSYLVSGAEYMDRGGNLSVSQDEIPNGIHRIWRLAFRDEEKATNTLVRMSNENNVRVLRGLDPIYGYSSGSQISNRKTREYRGIVTGATDGYALTYISPQPSNTMGFSFFGKAYFCDNMLSGYTVLGRNEYSGRRRMSRSILEFLPQNTKSILDAGRMSNQLSDIDTLPSIIHDYLTLPLA